MAIVLETYFFGPQLYHQRVFERLFDVTKNLTPGSPQFAQAVENELQVIAKLLNNNNSLLNGIGL